MSRKGKRIHLDIGPSGRKALQKAPEPMHRIPCVHHGVAPASGVSKDMALVTCTGCLDATTITCSTCQGKGTWHAHVSKPSKFECATCLNVRRAHIDHMSGLVRVLNERHRMVNHMCTACEAAGVPVPNQSSLVLPCNGASLRLCDQHVLGILKTWMESAGADIVKPMLDLAIVQNRDVKHLC